eukprot:5785458-Amphidinium_carterae.2
MRNKSKTLQERARKKRHRSKNAPAVATHPPTSYCCTFALSGGHETHDCTGSKDEPSPPGRRIP